MFLINKKKKKVNDKLFVAAHDEKTKQTTKPFEQQQSQCLLRKPMPNL